ncbi:hypothetical protein RYA95_05005 [Pseudomonas syringae pv. actinidiae]|uniref:baseplate hub protein n=1 Tax=Pseudomonas syringae TaxID=317 RepID=UPI000467D281|nr:hypothetical protein [Pseudomonas syringae]AYL80557.1 hypothetical protein CN228_11845 [Pseudomonas syringae pv. actinidiae str. Shaanxi_M228]MDU8612504.1 hypothetical protein [Pseudomonas syringae pv. actinidiae]OSN84906.1 hypothetical protein BV352_01576 [Pseudomonas syringae pv. actinidiae]
MATPTNLQYDRRYSLTIGDYSTGNGLLITSEDTDHPLQITFEVNKTSDTKHKAGNSTTIEIYNLTPVQAKLLESQYISFEFRVGYNNEDGLSLIAQGNVTEATTVKRGTDTITQIKVGEGYVALDHTRISQNLSPGQTVEDVIRVIVAAMPGISRGPIVGTNLSSPIVHGWRLSGTAKEELDKITKAYNLEYSISNNTLIMTDLNQPTSKTVLNVPVISSETGMIDKPFRITEQIRLGKRDKRTRPGIQVKTLLNPAFTVSSVVKIESDDINGYFRINSLRYNGEFRGQPWYSELRCSEMTDADITIE